MAMKRLVVCCDGTWNDADSIDDLTNVSRLAWAIKPVDERGNVPQIVFYQSGVGSEGDIVDKIKGGGLGLGLARNVRDAYTFICNNYCDGDEIFLFGFSRGAYTARSVGGLIGYAGLLGKRDLDRFMALWDGYRTGSKDKPNGFADRHKDVEIKCIGVWDTVGSLGIPGILGRPFEKYYGFHNTELGAHVQHAFHGLALDEQRKDFQPALWKQKPEGKAKGQKLKQVWFAGAHSDVGGGYPDHGLSDISLAWMASELEPMLGIDFDYLLSRRDVSSKWALGLLHDSAEGVIWQKRGKVVRKPFAEDQALSFESLHPSVAERIKGGEHARPGKYALAAGSAADKAVGTLSQREIALRWADADVKQAAQRAKSESESIMRKIGGLFGLD